MSKPAKKVKVRDMPQVLVRITPHRMDKLRRLAEENERSLSAQARLFLNRQLDNEEAPA